MSLVWILDWNLDDIELYSELKEQNITASITTVKPYASALRYPLVHSEDLISCFNTSFAPAQQVYIAIGLSNFGSGIRESNVIVMHIEELAMVDFEAINETCSDIEVPNPSAECVFNPAMRPDHYVFRNCWTCATKNVTVKNDFIDKIDIRFMDAPRLIGDMNSYEKDNNLNPYAICEAIMQYIGNYTIYMDCIQKITVLYTNTTLGKCDALLFNMHFTLLQAFFESFWQDNLFIMAHNFEPAENDDAIPLPNPSVIHVVAKTVQLLENGSFGDFNLTFINSITALGRIFDLYISNNGQHMYMAQTRYRYELASLERFKLICDMLNNDPDSAVFLEKYKFYCLQFPPSPPDIRQFGMFTSSCSNGILCNDFDNYVVESTVHAGHFVFNHLTQVECPPGVYCSSGVINMCPKGFKCDIPGLALPRPCAIDEFDSTCYLSPLGSIPCPFGTICANGNQPPLLAPPGYAVWRKEQLSKTVSLKLRYCKRGSYCPLGLEVSEEINGNQEADSWMQKRLKRKQKWLFIKDERVLGAPEDILLCPANMYCENSTVLAPKPCLPYNSTNSSEIKMPYCPAGSYEEVLCPAGHCCHSPSEIRNCSKAEFCPAGSIVSDVCKEGYYCPDPTQQILCPKDYFCRQGSTSPMHCSFLANCPPGSTKDSLTPFAIGVIILILLLILLAYSAFRYYNFMYKKMSLKQRLVDLEKINKKRMTRKSSALDNDNEKLSLLENRVDSAEYGLSEQTDVASEILDGDAIKRLTLLDPAFTADIQFEELGLTVRSTGVRVLHGVTGEIKHGELTCVMGLSGSGKSTFITTLAGRAYYGIPEGTVRVNGVQCNLTNFNRRIGFVPQDDIMCRDCTVEETLYFAAKTRLDRRITGKEITRIVNNVISVLRLEDVRHSVIGDETNRGISGGQRKRVNVGIELVAQPVILFCDEPTSGLDSASSKEVCEVLQDIAKSGITVVTVIHQPRFEIFEMFEQLLLLGKGGKTCYLGPVKTVKQYFENMGFVFPPQVNVADYLMDITAGNALPRKEDISKYFTEPYTPEQLQEKWKALNPSNTNSIDSSIQLDTHLNTNLSKFKNPSLSYIRQFWMCLLRSITQQIRGIGSLIQDFFLVFICGLFLGLIFYNKSYIGPVEQDISNQCPKALRSICEMPLDDPVFKLASMMNLGMALTGIMASLKVFGKEKVVYMRESQTGLSTFCFFWSKDIAVLPMTVLAPWVFLVMYYTLIDPRAKLYEIYYVLLLTYWSSYGLGYLVSILIHHVNAQLFAVVFIFILNVFSGSTIAIKEFKGMSTPLNLLPYFSFLSFGLEMCYLTEIRYYKHIYNIQRSLDLFGYEMKDMKWMWGALLAYGFAFRIMAVIALWCSRPDSIVLLIKNTISNWILLRTKNCLSFSTNRAVSVEK